MSSSLVEAAAATAEGDASMDGLGSASASRIARAELEHVRQYQRFLVTQRNYTVQYSHVYTQRLHMLRAVALHAAHQKWGTPATGGYRECPKIIDLRPEGWGASEGGAAASSSSSSSSSAAPQSWVVAGCIYKEQPLKPSILDAFASEKGVDQPKPRANYASPTGADSLILEDESGRIAVTAGTVRLQSSGGRRRTSSSSGPRVPFPLRQLVDVLVTGVVVALRGRILADGELAVEDVCVPGLGLLPPPLLSTEDVAFPPLPRPLPPATPKPLVLLVSGLSLGLPSPGSHPLAPQLLLEWVAGMAGAGGDTAAAARIVRVVIAGGLVGKQAASLGSQGRTILSSSIAAAPAPAPAASATGGSSSAASASPFSDRSLSAGEADAAASAMAEADSWLSALAASVPVDVMPSDSEPTGFTLPQQPLHPCLFHASARFSSVAAVTNPYACSVGGVRLLGSAGQPVADICRYAAADTVLTPGSELEALLAAAGHKVDDDGDDDGDDTDEAGAGAGSSSGAAMDADEDGSGGSGSSSFSTSGGAGAGAGAGAAAAAATDGADKALAVLTDTGAGKGLEDRIAAGSDGYDLASRLNPLDILTNTLYWRCVAPTAPDTLAAYPFDTADPFVISAQHMPHVYFAGMQSGYGSRLVADASGAVRVRVLSVPDFARTGTAVLLDLSSPTLETQPVCFALDSLVAADAEASALQGYGVKLRTV